MIGQMAIVIALLGFNDLGRLQLSPHCPKMSKKSMWDGKKIHDFCQRDIESCQHAAARRVKLWSPNVNLLFEEPHQLTNFPSKL